MGRSEKVEQPKRTTGPKAASGTPHEGSPLRREASGVGLLALALFLALSLGSLQFGAGGHHGQMMGPFGEFFATCAYGAIGLGAWLVALALGVAAVRLLMGRPLRLRAWEVAAWLASALFAAVLLHLASGTHRLRGYSTGGLLGEYGAELLVAFLGTVGTVLVALTGLVLSALATTPLTVAGAGRTVATGARRLWAGFARAALAAFPKRGDSDRETQEANDEAVPVLLGEPAALAPTTKIAATHEDAATPEPSKVRRRGPRSPRIDVSATQLDAAGAARQQEEGAPAPVIRLETRKTAAAPPAPTSNAGTGAVPSAAHESDDRTDATPAPAFAPLAQDASGPVAAPTIVAPLPRKQPAAVVTPRGPLDYVRHGEGAFRLPTIDMLDYDEAAHDDLDRQAMLDLAERLEKTLADYGVKGRVSEIHPGPVVTMYEFVPQAGTKLSKITSLSNDLAMALEALKVRIVAPIPGKAAVGIEVPNRVRETVYLKEIVASDTFGRARSKLAMALGKDIAGNPVVVDLAKMPHLLVAGTTGSGKSVSVNAMICSMLFNASPDEVKLIMIDPKMLELSIYEGIPHLLLPVVTDPKKANLALRWAVEEMERRYDLISKAGVRDIASYNKKVEKLLASGAAAKAPIEPTPMLNELPKITVTIGEGDEAREVEVEATEQAVMAAGGVVSSEVLDEISEARATLQAAQAMRQLELEARAKEEPPTKLPLIVIVIDEFADLMMVASKEVEQSVARIAQKARAAGIHLMLATQRPSVDVITGLIKANFPSRIAFQVASKIDARTILDQQGAESLLGMGDMLFTDRGLALQRVHGPLVTDGEIHRIVDHLKAQGTPVYDLDILKPRDEEGGESGGEPECSDEMYDQAVAVISEMSHASTSMLQRRLRLGYNRAARIIERMEREGIVGPADGARPREVLIRSHAA